LKIDPYSDSIRRIGPSFDGECNGCEGCKLVRGLFTD